MAETDQKELSESEPVKRRRKAPEDRVRDIVDAAADHFAEVGFAGGTRDIAKRLGVTQPLLYRYFPDKDGLIEAVYKSVYLESWKPEWDAGLQDRAIPVRRRFEDFYRDYIEENFNPRWLRISYFAGLRDAKVNQWYNHLVEELILKQLVREHRNELGLGDEAYVSPEEMEPTWQMHGGLLHFGWRRHVLDLPTASDTGQVIGDALDMYFAIAPKVYARAAPKDVDNGHE
ncbi:MAG: TetR/AcrR family transcriptional regulator [Pseudomonadota bacterium]